MVAYGSGWRAAAEQKYKCAGAEHRKKYSNSHLRTPAVRNSPSFDCGIFFAVLQVEFAPKIRNLSTCRVVGWLLRSFRSRAARNALVVSRASKQASKAKASKQEEPLPTELPFIFAAAESYEARTAVRSTNTRRFGRSMTQDCKIVLNVEVSAIRTLWEPLLLQRSDMLLQSSRGGALKR